MRDNPIRLEKIIERSQKWELLESVESARHALTQRPSGLYIVKRNAVKSEKLLHDPALFADQLLDVNLETRTMAIGNEESFYIERFDMQHLEKYYLFNIIPEDLPDGSASLEGLKVSPEKIKSRNRRIYDEYLKHIVRGLKNREAYRRTAVKPRRITRILTAIPILIISFAGYRIYSVEMNNDGIEGTIAQKIQAHDEAVISSAMKKLDGELQELAEEYKSLDISYKSARESLKEMQYKLFVRTIPKAAQEKWIDYLEGQNIAKDYVAIEDSKNPGDDSQLYERFAGKRITAILKLYSYLAGKKMESGVETAVIKEDPEFFYLRIPSEDMPIPTGDIIPTMDGYWSDTFIIRLDKRLLEKYQSLFSLQQRKGELELEILYKKHEISRID